MVIFLLALVGVLLIVLNLRSINKDKGLFKENLSSSIENIDENEIKMGKFRVEIAESFLDLQTQMQHLKEENDLLRKRIITLEGNNCAALKIDKIIDDPIILNSIYEADTDNNNPEMDLKINEVQKLLDMGISIDEVAVKLCIGKGEVILIKNLYLK
jgi:hypothetical protein